ncbi:MAG: Hsp20/alpha crystallin family protein [Acidobacteria bacterium]|nr:Hsp20/alpha crystallin family protein [Acidobacteriota bacterium]
MVRMTKWDPVREMARVSEDMTRLVDELFGGRMARESVRGSWVPPVDIRETDDAIEIHAELPGFNAEDVDVTVENGVLTIRGERKLEETREGETWHRVERAYGVFERAFQVPRNVDATKVKAQFNNGVLQLTLPKREESKPRSIKVQVK